MNPTAVEEAAKNNFPMDHLIGVWWSGGDQDARPAGAAGKGYTTLDINGVGQNYPAIQDILKYVVDKGKSQVTEGPGRREPLQPGCHECGPHCRRYPQRAEIDRQETDRRCRHAPWLGVAQASAKRAGRNWASPALPSRSI